MERARVEGGVKEISFPGRALEPPGAEGGGRCTMEKCAVVLSFFRTHLGIPVKA